MYPLFFALLIAMFVVGAGKMLRRHLLDWTPIGKGLWFQVMQSNAAKVVTYRTSSLERTSRAVPALWEIKHPFSSKPKYISQHPDQLRQWWEPLAHKYYGLDTKNHKIDTVSFAPTLGIYVGVKMAKTNEELHSEQCIQFMEEARDTWKPKRYDFDSTSTVRQTLMERLDWLFAAVIFVLLHYSWTYQYVSFDHDLYYFKIGMLIALTVAAGVVYWFYPKFEGSAYRKKALTTLAMAIVISLGATIPPILIYTNMLHTRTLCEFNAPVKEWTATSGKNRRYHAHLDMRACHVPLSEEISVQVPYSVFAQQSSTLPIRVTQGLLGRYAIETK